MIGTYQLFRYLLMAVDPVHIGAGGYRLGRVDLTVVREPGTNLPVVPGTSLNGAARSYAARLLGRPRCAGQGQPERDGEGRLRSGTGHCAQDNCPICYTFGFTVGQSDEARSYAGTVNLYDARMLAYPVASMAGPVWVTTEEALNDAGIRLPGGSPRAKGTVAVAAWDWNRPRLNLGWMMLDCAAERWQLPDDVPWRESREWQTVARRLVLVAPDLFGHIVQSNLEVRTSVSIDPETGAADEGALFTYEAVARGALFWFDAVEDVYRQEPFPTAECAWGEDGPDRGEPLTSPWRRPVDVVQGGLEMMEWLGVGGMGTRGFGRMRLIGTRWEVSA